MIEFDRDGQTETMPAIINILAGMCKKKKEEKMPASLCFTFEGWEEAVAFTEFTLPEIKGDAGSFIGFILLLFHTCWSYLSGLRLLTLIK